MQILMSISKSTQVLSKFYFRDTPEQDQRAWEQYGLSGPISAIRRGLQCAQGWGGFFGMARGRYSLYVGWHICVAILTSFFTFAESSTIFLGQNFISFNRCPIFLCQFHSFRVLSGTISIFRPFFCKLDQIFLGPKFSVAGDTPMIFSVKYIHPLPLPPSKILKFR